MSAALQIFFCLMVSLSVQAQPINTNKGVISGQILTNDNEPAESVAVQLAGTGKMTLTTESGFYIFKNLPPGTYHVNVTVNGFKPLEATVVLAENGKQNNISFKLELSDAQLAEVVISSGGRYKVDRVSSSLRLPSSILETPQNIQVISKRTLADQQVFDVVDGITRNVSGVSRMGHWDNQYANIRMRGSKIPAFRNGMNIDASWGPTAEDAAMIENIEFVKGPAGFMLAAGEPGGFYNVVTKKPTGSSHQSISMSAGSFSTYRAALDLDGKLSKDGRLLYRLNLAAQQKDYFTKFNFNNRVVIAPVIKYQIDDKTSVTFEYTYQAIKFLSNGNYSFSKEKLADEKVANDFFYGDPSLPPGKIRDHSVYVYLDHQLNDRWKAHAQVAYFNFAMASGSMWPDSLFADGRMTRYYNIGDEAGENRFAQVSISGEEQTGSVRHRILGGLDFGNKKFWGDFRSGNPKVRFARVIDPVTKQPYEPVFNIYNPIYGLSMDSIPKFDRSVNIRTRSGSTAYATYTNYASAYVQDELGFFNNNLRVSLGLRFTYAETVGKTETSDIKDQVFSPRAGVSYSIDKQTSVYGLYDQSFVPVPGTDFWGNAFKPIKGNDIEFGVKKEWFGGRWVSSVSVYQINRMNALVADPDPTHTNGAMTFQTQLGETESKGVEFDLNGELVKGLNLVANYAYTSSKISKDIDPKAVGTVTPNTNAHTTNAWLSYRFSKGALNGFGVNGGIQWLADRYVGTTTTPNMPNYFRADAGVSFQKNKFGVSMLVNNLLDNRKLLTAASLDTNPNSAKTYYSYIVEARRNMRMTVTYKF
ncbi:ferrichrome-iron receptor [Niastella yeongjuensis]|uniref:Ferrichrome-iron receptor n=1 Tax=Niastella yeongjuensis TaxID=354355 RepID=A0A1V9EAN1_9BACT|nr:ferrichrome-iron receptor [Niastella yeongjuensis]SEO55403.1 iron complex outermembrane recepter protein [Niastella yeongjuensis]